MKTTITAVTTTPAPITPTPGTASMIGLAVAVTNTGATAVVLGGPDVTSTTGIPLAAGATLPLGGVPCSPLWAVTASGSSTVALLVA